MNEKQFDLLVTELRVLQDKVHDLTEIVTKQHAVIVELTNKTLVISDVGREITKLKTDVQALKDEKEM